MKEMRVKDMRTKEMSAKDTGMNEKKIEKRKPWRGRLPARVFAACLTAAVVFSLAACGGAKESAGNDGAGKSERSGSVKEEAGEYLEAGGTKLRVGMEITDKISEKLGEPKETMSAPSCHFDGDDTISVYDGFTLYTYRDGEKDILYLIEITGEGYDFSGGGAVGLTRSEIEKAYGDEYEELGAGIRYTLSDDEYLSVFFEEDTVTSLELGDGAEEELEGE